VFLKSLTLKGFKSFAEKSVLQFEPGITVIVGPNGSGKSNVVDAIAWVLGEQGAKALRGGKMDDVIFGGAGNRAPLGRAEVTLTIDNTSGALPIEYSEVSISRLLYRSGESEYRINGDSCRLLDITELLSDTGVGRELHTIVSQGNLDEVLHGRPEDRRAAIEEAAGIYKHRRRKDRALRKLAGVEQQLVRLSDLVGEMRRQLKPLQQQAEAARRAAEVQAELREVRLTLRVRELAAVRREAQVAAANQEQLAGQLAELERLAAEATEIETAAATALDGLEPRAARAKDTVHQLLTVRERLRGTLALAQERARSLAQPLAEEGEGRSPEDMLREAAQVAEELAALDEELATAEELTTAAEGERAAARAELARFDAAAAEAERARTLALQHTVELQGEAAAITRGLDRAGEEIATLAHSSAGLAGQVEETRARLEALQAEAGELESREEGLAGTAATADAARAAAATALDTLTTRQRGLESAVAAARARREAHEAAARAAGGDTLATLEAKGPDGLLGPLAPALAVDEGYEAAVAAALGPDATAVLVDSVESAAAAVDALQQTGAGRATLLFPGGDTAPGGNGRPLLLDRVRATGPAAEVAAALLGGVLVADDLAGAWKLLGHDPSATVVTRAGELVARTRLEGGAAPESGALANRRAALEAAEEADRLRAELDQVAEAVEAAEARLRAADAEVGTAGAALNASDAAINAAADRLAKVNEEHRALERELAAAAARQAELEAGRLRDQRRLEQLRAALAAADAGEGDPDTTTDDDPAEDRRVLAEAVDVAAERAVSAQVARSALRERRRILAGREQDLRRRAEAEAEAEQRRAAARAARLDGARAAGEAAGLASRVLGHLEQSLAAATVERDQLAASVTEARTALAGASERRKAASGELESLRDRSRSADAGQLEARMRDDDLSRRLVEEFGADPEQAFADYLPEDTSGLPEGDPRRLPDNELRRAAATLDRRLALLGRVNPLALEDFKALEERHTFLAGQLADLKDSRRDLLKVIKAVDIRVREVFGQAFEDVAREFDRTFGLLFPGGEGRLILTDPEDMLTTGVEVEARPPGKRLRRLSLLSGGERSLVALAFSFAIFRARPSPFYVLDEVEAALDDVNLQRFLTLLEDIRDRAQLLVVSHQRRTMEAADALYGVSMQAGGVSKVLSQRLRKPDGTRRSPFAERDGEASANGNGNGNGAQPAPEVVLDEPSGAGSDTASDAASDEAEGVGAGPGR
jgi:chromosome segregation protein